MVFDWLRARRRKRLLASRPIPDRFFETVAAGIAVLREVEPDRRRGLYDAATLFLHEKRFEGCGGLELTAELRCAIALQACLLVLGLPVGVDAFAAVRTVLVYPEGFTARRRDEDEFGIVTEGHEELLGEAWDEGQVVLNAHDVVDGGAVRDGFNLVLHEFAHQLDMASGEDDGVPPLPAGMDRQEFAQVLADAAAALDAADARGEETAVDPYAADSPAEAFAVFTEAFFEIPDLLAEEFPEVHARLAAFYRQLEADPR